MDDNQRHRMVLGTLEAVAGDSNRCKDNHQSQITHSSEGTVAFWKVFEVSAAVCGTHLLVTCVIQSWFNHVQSKKNKWFFLVWISTRQSDSIECHCAVSHNKYETIQKNLYAVCQTIKAPFVRLKYSLCESLCGLANAVDRYLLEQLFSTFFTRNKSQYSKALHID